jgi:hypothetical protein
MRTKIIIYQILIMFILTAAAFGQGFYVKSISKDYQTVMICEKGTSRKWKVQKGDKIDGWTIVDIQQDKVIMRGEPDEDQIMVHQMTLPANQPGAKIQSSHKK